jgi:hypothetical protein
MKPVVKFMWTFSWCVSYSEWSKEGDALSPLHLNFALEYVMNKAQGNKSELNETHWLMVCGELINWAQTYMS